MAASGTGLLPLPPPTDPHSNNASNSEYKGWKMNESVTLTGHTKKVHSVAWNCNGTKLASGSVDKTARLWSIDRHGHGKELTELRGHTDSVDQLCWDPTHVDRLATASGDKTVRVWDARTAKQTNSVSTVGENINISWSPDALYIAVGSKDDCISIIDTRKFRVIKKSVFKYEVNEFSWNRNGEYFFLTSGQSNGRGTVEVMKFSRESLDQVHTLEGHFASCYCLDFDSTGQYLAVGGADAVVSLWDLEDSMCIRTMTRLDYPIRTVSFSPDGQFLAAASEDLVIDISDTKTGDRAFALDCKAAMNSIAWHPKSNILAYAGDEKLLDSRGRELQGVIRLVSLTNNQP